MCAECDKLKAKIEDSIGYTLLNGKRALLAHAMKNSDFKKAMEMPEKDLPLHVNDGGIVQEVVAKRLAGSEVSPALCIEAMSDVGFDMDDYYDVGWEDGALSVVQDIYTILDKPDKSKEAYMCVYKE